MTLSTDKINGRSTYPPRPINPVGSLLNHFPMVILISITVFILGTMAVFVKIKPFYEVEAVLKTEPVIPKVLYGKEEASIMPYYDDYVRTQINIVKSTPVLSAALSAYEQKGFHWLLPEETVEQAAGRLAARLTINQIRDTQLFSLSMTARRKEGLAELVNAVANAFLAANENEQLNKDASRLSFLKKRKTDIEAELSDNYAVLQNISSKYAVGITDEKNIYVYLQAIVDLTQQLVKASSRRIEVESKLNVLKTQLGQLAELDLSANVDEWVEQDWSIRDNRIQLSRKLQDLRLNLSGVDRNHPDFQEYEKNLDKLNEVQNNLIQRSKQVGEKVLRGKLIADQQEQIRTLETEYAAAMETENELRAELKSAELKATDVNTQMMKASTLRRNIQRLQDSLLRIDERIDQIEVESRAPGRISLMTPARSPESPASGKRSKMMIIVILFGLVSGLGYAIGRDKFDSTIHTPHDIERVLGFSATGHIMDAVQDREPVTDLYRVVQERPQARISEQFKEIAFSLALEHDQHQSRIFSCFSLEPKQGATTFIVNTLCALQGRRGRRIMVDLNIWRPFSRAILPENRAGIMDVLQGTCDLKDAVFTSEGYPFDILSYGQRNPDDPNLFQETGFGSLIESLRLDYEFIFIDAPPMGMTTDARFLAELADVAILIVVADQVPESALFRTVSLLDNMDVKVIAVVLNKVRFIRGKYYRSAMEKYYAMIDAQNRRRAT